MQRRTSALGTVGDNVGEGVDEHSRKVEKDERRSVVE
jgi:hypothetical protein